MKKLNSYIIEKFKINKDTKVTYDEFKRGDPIMRIAVFSYKSNVSKLEINNIIYFYEILDGRIKFSILKDKNVIDSYPFEGNMFINSNGYLEFTGESSIWNGYVIYLPKEKAIKFLKDIALNFDKEKDKINEYFDKDDLFNSLTIRGYDKDNIKKLINLYENS